MIAKFPSFTRVLCRMETIPYDIFTFQAMVNDTVMVYNLVYTLKRAAQQQQSNMRTIYKNRNNWEYKQLLSEYWIPINEIDTEVEIRTTKSIKLFRAEKAHETPAIVALDEMLSMPAFDNMRRDKSTSRTAQHFEFVEDDIIEQDEAMQAARASITPEELEEMRKQSDAAIAKNRADMEAEATNSTENGLKMAGLSHTL